jgi:tRNA U34 5-methylaminomethyl-2-thiouridine-forming methyltransferase MnmC
MMEKPEIILTGDGFPTLYSAHFNEIYHSRHGSLTESQHVFIRNGLEAKLAEGQKKITIGELGLGSGLNAALAFQYAMRSNVKIDYQSLEAYPLQAEIWTAFNEKLPEELQSIHKRLMVLPSGELHQPEPLFSFQWRIEFWPAAEIFEKLDVLFYDAFSPEKQPELWTAEAFAMAFEAMHPGGILVTYCAKGYVRRNMEAAGFVTERLPGPPGKREMLRAMKP